MDIIRDNGEVIVVREGQFIRFADYDDMWQFACELASLVQIKIMGDIFNRTGIPEIFLKAFEEGE